MPETSAPTVHQYSVSDLLPFLECNYRGAIRMQDRLWTPPSNAMRLGTALHNYCQHILTHGRPDPTALHNAPQELQGALEPLLEAADRHLIPFPMKLLAVEQSIGIRISRDVEAIGRLDFISQEEAGLWSGQFKTIGKGQDIGRFLEKVRMSPHEILYRDALRKATNRKVCGTLLGVFRTYLTKQQKEDNVPIFEFFPLTATKAEDEEAAFELTIQFENLDNAAWQTVGSYRHRTRNWAACTSIFGTCPLLEHCHHKANRSTCLTVPLENRYTDLPPLPIGNGTVPTGAARFGDSPWQSALAAAICS